MKTNNLNISKLEIEELKKVSNNFDEDYNKVLKGYPIQYLIGYVNFYGYKINVNSNVLIPRYETEYLTEKIIKYSRMYFNNKLNILDIGTGSGCIGIALKKELDSNITMCDISDKALELASVNAKNNNVEVNIVKSDIFSNINGKYDIIISNPPYIDYNEEIMDSVKKYEPHTALYASDNGLYFYKEILKNAKKYLKEKSIIAFEIGWHQGNAVKELAMEYFENSKVVIEKDLSSKDRYIFIFNNVE